jgi:hypothetical protein
MATKVSATHGPFFAQWVSKEYGKMEEIPTTGYREMQDVIPDIPDTPKRKKLLEEIIPGTKHSLLDVTVGRVSDFDTNVVNFHGLQVLEVGKFSPSRYSLFLIPSSMPFTTLDMVVHQLDNQGNKIQLSKSTNPLKQCCIMGTAHE